MHWNLLNDHAIGSLKFLKLKYRRWDEIIQLFCRIGSHQEIVSPLFNLSKVYKTERSTAESCRMHWSLLNYNEFGSLKFLKFKYRRGNQIIQPFCRIISPKKLGPPSLTWANFKKVRKNTPELSRMLWNLLNDQEFGSLKFLKLKYRRVDQINQPFYRIDSPRKLGHPLVIWANFKTLRKVLLNHVECIGLYWMTKNLRPSNF